MDKIRLGKTGLMVSRIGFGGIPIQRLSEEDAVAVVKTCLDLGITFFDTANNYTTSEARIGKAIVGRNRRELILATKSAGRTKEVVEQNLANSLKIRRTHYLKTDDRQHEQIDSHPNCADCNQFGIAIKQPKNSIIKQLYHDKGQTTNRRSRKTCLL